MGVVGLVLGHENAGWSWREENKPTHVKGTPVQPVGCISPTFREPQTPANAADRGYLRGGKSG